MGLTKRIRSGRNGNNESRAMQLPVSPLLGLRNTGNGPRLLNSSALMDLRRSGDNEAIAIEQ
jgi:hypothetical protein